MELKDYLRKLSKEGREEFARQAHTSVGYLYLVAGGHRRASSEKARAIEAASGGEVSRKTLRPDLASF